MSLLIISTAIFVLKCTEKSSVTKQLKALFDVLDLLSFRGAPLAYFDRFSCKPGEAKALPHRIFVEFYSSDGTERIKILLDGTFQLYDGKLAYSTFDEDGYLNCIHCERIVGCAHLERFETQKSRIVIFFKDRNLLKFSNMKVQIAEAFELFMDLANKNVKVTTAPMREVVITKTVIDNGGADVNQIAKVLINNSPVFIGAQPYSFFTPEARKKCHFCDLVFDF